MNTVESKINSNLEKRIMRRIHLIFLSRKYIFNGLALKTYLSFVLIASSISMVSIISIINNTWSLVKFDANSLSYFYKYAFLHTETGVKVMFSSLLLFTAFLFFTSLVKPIMGRILQTEFSGRLRAN